MGSCCFLRLAVLYKYVHFSWSRLQLRFFDNSMILKVSKISIEIEQPQVKVKYT